MKIVKMPILLVLLCGLLVYAAPVNALPIDFYDGTWIASGEETSTRQIYDILAEKYPTFNNYKAEVYSEEQYNPALEEGPLQGAYQTIFRKNALEDLEDGPSGAIIQYVGDPQGPVAPDLTYLLVKDGGGVPSWVLYDLYSLGWDPTDTITLVNFWYDDNTNYDGGGAISFVAFLGNEVSPVPEPATMLLFGTGLVGLAFGARRKLKKA